MNRRQVWFGNMKNWICPWTRGNTECCCKDEDGEDDDPTHHVLPVGLGGGGGLLGVPDRLHLRHVRAVLEKGSENIF